MWFTLATVSCEPNNNVYSATVQQLHMSIEKINKTQNSFFEKINSGTSGQAKKKKEENASY